MFVYMKVTKDKFELPLIVEDSVRGLARRCGVNASTVCHAFKNKNSQYVRVEIEDEKRAPSSGKELDA